MNLLLLTLVVISQAPAPVDVSAYKLTVATDGKKHYLAYEPKKMTDGALFYGDDKALYQVPVRGGGYDDTSASAIFWDPRVKNAPDVRVPADGSDVAVSCSDSDKTTKFTPLSAEEGQKVLEGAKIMSRRFLRLPERLMRDDKANYYFIDRFRSNDDSRRDFRLFIGPRGKLKMQPLKDIVDDTEGMIFSTKTGELRLVTGRDQKWVAGKKELKLIDVPLDDSRNVRMVYLDLGVFDGQPLGTPCDDLP
jgi:hypothetical protein